MKIFNLFKQSVNENDDFNNVDNLSALESIKNVDEKNIDENKNFDNNNVDLTYINTNYYDFITRAINNGSSEIIDTNSWKKVVTNGSSGYADTYEFFGYSRNGEKQGKPWVVCIEVVDRSAQDDFNKSIVRASYRGDTGIKNVIAEFQIEHDKLNVFLKHKFKISDTIELKKDKIVKSIEPMEIGKNEYGNPIFFKERLTLQNSATNHAKERIFTIFGVKDKITFTQKVAKMKYFVRMTIFDMEINKKIDDMADDHAYESFDEALQEIKGIIDTWKHSNYASEGEYGYIPEGSTIHNWNFRLNLPKDFLKASDEDSITIESQLFTEDTALSRYSQSDFSQYLNGNIPDYMEQYIGTPQVDISQLKSKFPASDKALSLVNEVAPDLLKNITWIFDSSDSGSYGVYVPSIDRQIKTKALKKMLENKGYKIVDEKGMLTAYPLKEEKTTEQIENDINQLYQHLESKGGTVFGINVGRLVSQAQSEANGIGSPLSNLWQLLAIYHIAETMVHEAVHAQGHHSEAEPERVEKNFMNSVKYRLNQEYLQELQNMGQEDAYQPLTFSKTMGNWYKYAQAYNVYPSSMSKPTGTDLHGRAGYQGNDNANYGLMSHQNAAQSIESKLGRQYMSPLPEGLSQENDSIELQLRKVDTGEPLDSKATLGELLSVCHVNDNRQYQLIEKNMEDRRPQPLMVTMDDKKMKRKAYSYKKTTFGWYNNLDISDGSTIPGLSDRVMAWDDRDECFSEEEDWIRSQPRYNPDNGPNGIRYNYVELRFRPRLWTEDVEDFANVHPAKRFASSEFDENFENDIYRMFKIIKSIARKISGKNPQATRLIASNELCPLIIDIVQDNCYSKEIQIDDDTMAIWLYGDDSIIKDIDMAEKYFSGNCKEAKPIADKLLDSCNYKHVEKIVDVAKKICLKKDIDDLYIVGQYAMKKKKGEKPDVCSLDFVMEYGTNILSIGNQLAEELGIETAKMSKDGRHMNFVYNGIDIEMVSGKPPRFIRKLIEREGMFAVNSLNGAICNRDFTLNMAIYNVVEDTVEYFPGCSDQEITTYFPSEEIIKNNPLIILRALYMNIKYGLPINKKVEMNMISYGKCLTDVSDREKDYLIGKIVEECGEERANKLFNQYKLKFK